MSYDVVRIDSEHDCAVEWETDDLDEAITCARQRSEADDTRPYEVWESESANGPVTVHWSSND